MAARGARIMDIYLIGAVLFFGLWLALTAFVTVFSPHMDRYMEREMNLRIERLADALMEYGDELSTQIERAKTD